MRGGAAGARLGEELEGEARLAASLGVGHAQVAKARLPLVMVAHAPALPVGHRPTGIARRVSTIGPVSSAIIRQVAHDLAAVPSHLPGAGRLSSVRPGPPPAKGLRQAAP